MTRLTAPFIAPAIPLAVPPAIAPAILLARAPRPHSGAVRHTGLPVFEPFAVADPAAPLLEFVR